MYVGPSTTVHSDFIVNVYCLNNFRSARLFPNFFRRDIATPLAVDTPYQTHDNVYSTSTGRSVNKGAAFQNDWPFVFTTDVWLGMVHVRSVR